MTLAERQSRVRETFRDVGVDALLVTDLHNVRYLTGFSGTNAQLLVSPDKSVFLTDPRYEARAASLVEGAEIEIYPSRLTDKLVPLLQRHRIVRLGIEGRSMTLAAKEDLQARLNGIELIATAGIVEALRRHKDAAEVNRLREAVALGDRAFGWILEHLAPGVTERQVALDLEFQMRAWGADEVSFPPIVGSGPLSAHIHHSPGSRELQKGDLVLLDFGCRLDGYCSDLTRTVVLGPPTQEQSELYRLVLEAQRRGIGAVGPGVACADVDGASRDVIEAAGQGEHFGHGLGHGVGLDVHEDPRLNRISEATLVVGDVVTVEPGVYLQGTGGIRIEDCVVVTEEGREVLGTAPKGELISV